MPRPPPRSICAMVWPSPRSVRTNSASSAKALPNGSRSVIWLPICMSTPATFRPGSLAAREVYARAAKLPGLKVAGVDMHIGSQITELDPFGDAFTLLADFVRTLRGDGHTISHVDLGGGLGIPYRDDNEPPPLPEAYAEVVKRVTRDFDCRLIFEPGRLIVGNAGILVTRVLFVKHGEGKNFIVVDAAMNDLIRPTLYDAYHEIWPVAEVPTSTRRIRADVV